MFYKKTKQDDYSTPKCYLEVIDKYIPKDKQINDPFYFNGLVKVFWKELGRDIIHEDKDFFSSAHDGDIFVSNPPFSNLKEVIIQLFCIGKPFALLVPIQKITQIKIQRVLSGKNVQVIVSPIYKGFINKDNQQTRCSSQYFCYLCWGLGLERDLVIGRK